MADFSAVRCYAVTVHTACASCLHEAAKPRSHEELWSVRRARHSEALAEVTKAIIVDALDELNFWLKRFAPRVQLRVSTDAVIVVTSNGELHVPASISFRRDGHGEILGIGHDHTDAPDAVTVRLFTAAALSSPDYDNLLDKFFRLVLRRVPRSGSFIRPIVIVEGLNVLPRDVAPGIREALVRALANAGPAAILIDPAAN